MNFFKFCLDSKNRLNTADTTINFTVTVDMPHINNLNRICALQASIRQRHYMLTDCKNTRH